MARRSTREATLTGFEPGRTFRPLPRLTALVDLGRLLEIQDRRTWHPQRTFRPAVSLSGNRTRMVVSDARGLSPRVRFDASHRVVVCVRRKQRKEVMFALRKTGKGAKARRRRNRFSDMECR